MLRASICGLALAAPIGFLLGLQACSSEAPIENLCSWMTDESNCAARFEADVGIWCGYLPVPLPKPLPDAYTPADSATGTFLARDKLDICVRSEAIGGGQVVFDPPLNIATFPPASVAFTIKNARGAVCGAGAYAGNVNFSVTINPVSFADAGLLAPIEGSGIDFPYPGDDIQGGVYSSVREDGRDVFDVTCPGGNEQHHFNLWTLQTCPPASIQYLPTATFEAAAGAAPLDPGTTGAPTAGIPGYVRLRVSYPPLTARNGDVPKVVEYFNCAIPAPPHPCFDGIKDGLETYVDCGHVCPNLCQAPLACAIDDDCASHSCVAAVGIRQCAK